MESNTLVIKKTEKRRYDEIEIDLMDLLYQVALRWRILLTTGLVFFILGGGTPGL